MDEGLIIVTYGIKGVDTRHSHSTVIATQTHPEPGTAVLLVPAPP